MANRYFDNAATTPIDPRVFDAMLPFYKEYFNPSSVYSPARQVRKAIDNAREKIADSIGAEPREIFFTSGGTEANNWAIINTPTKEKNHIITAKTEHHAILQACEYMEKQGFNITYLDVDSDGLVNEQDIKRAITDKTAIISIMLANNEIGTIQPIADFEKYKNIVFHTDAVQAVGHMPVNVNDLGVDLLSLSAHKFYGPKGIGALYIRKGTKISPWTHGGSQERKIRPGTENVTGIIGMGKAIEIAEYGDARLRDLLIEQILENIPYTILNGHRTKRLSNNANITFRFIEGEALLIHLDMAGFQVSTGSACTSGSLDPSHVLLAMGVEHGDANGTLRFSLNKYHTESDIHELVDILKVSVKKLRTMSPLYDDFIKLSL